MKLQSASMKVLNLYCVKVINALPIEYYNISAKLKKNQCRV